MRDEESSTAEVASRGAGFWRRVLIWIVAPAVLLAAIWPFVSAARQSLDSEYTLHALVCVSYVTRAFMQSHAGNWPDSWEELEQTTIDHVPSMYRWPHDAGKVRERVEIDFNVSRETLTDPSFKVASVIRPRGEYIYDPATRLDRLQQYIDEQRQSRSTAQTSGSP